MGNKINPKIFRIQKLADWQSRWFHVKNYQDFLKQDVALREFLSKKLARLGLAGLDIERSLNSLKILIKTAKPGLIIGRGGSGIEQLKKEIALVLKKASPLFKIPQFSLEVEEVKQPQSNALVMANAIAEQIERRLPFRRVLKQTLEKIIQTKDVLGAKVLIKGRLNGNEIARREWLAKGQMPLQTLRSDIDYAQVTAYTTYGTIGIKIWVYKGEKKQ